MPERHREQRPARPAQEQAELQAAGRPGACAVGVRRRRRGSGPCPSRRPRARRRRSPEDQQHDQGRRRVGHAELEQLDQARAGRRRSSSTNALGSGALAGQGAAGRDHEDERAGRRQHRAAGAARRPAPGSSTQKANRQRSANRPAKPSGCRSEDLEGAGAPRRCPRRAGRRSSFMARPAGCRAGCQGAAAALRSTRSKWVGSCAVSSIGVARQVHVPQAREPEAKRAGAHQRRQQAELGALERPHARRRRRRAPRPAPRRGGRTRGRCTSRSGPRRCRTAGSRRRRSRSRTRRPAARPRT